MSSAAPLFQLLDLLDESRSHSYANDSAVTKRNITRSLMSIDVSESESQYTVHCEVPGVSKENIDISVENSVLTIKVTKENKTKIDENDYTHRERLFGSESRSVKLPYNADKEKISCSYENGLLQLTFAKTEPPKTVKKVLIQ